MVLLLVGLLLAVAAVGVVMVRSRRRGPRPIAIDPFTLGERWRRHVASAQSSQRRYKEIARNIPDGPLRTRLGEIDRQVQHAVEECYAIAKRGNELDSALARLDTGSLQAQHDRSADDTTRASLQAQLASAGRIRSTRDDTDARLRLLTTRMGELVAQAAEVSVGADTTEELGTGVGDVVTQLEALRLALNDVNNTGRPATSP